MTVCHLRTWWDEDVKQTAHCTGEASQLQPHQRDGRKVSHRTFAQALPAAERECILVNNRTRRWRSPGGTPSKLGTSYAIWLLPVALSISLQFWIVESFQAPWRAGVSGFSTPVSLKSPTHRPRFKNPHLADLRPQQEEAIRSSRQSSLQISKLRCIFHARLPASSEAARHMLPTLGHGPSPPFSGNPPSSQLSTLFLLTHLTCGSDMVAGKGGHQGG